MVASMALFQTRDLGRYLDEDSDHIKRTINSCRTEAELVDALASLSPNPGDRSLSLLRTRATFKESTVPGGVNVAITIPLDGDAQLLRCSSHQRALSSLVGRVYDNKWGDDEPTLVIEKTFPKPTPEEVKTWGKDVVDSIQSMLDTQRPQLDAHEAARSQIIEKTASQRRAVFGSAQSLRDALGEGI